ncbi:uncharacterized protein LOC126742780 isoform X2 [Anthonomus grandis grandis]|uniref:uncharacterized protein LOC126742780 isoform X2 n=1 Tax=Anthonomus grandis grandis TaxID=2921223 RepID=UPI002165FDA8|nr:uncharacterized protein LOC126742780 isoform X2 [Anthonomus grandis grandis]
MAIMMTVQEVVPIMREIKKDFDSSLSTINLRILDSQIKFEVPEDISQIQNLHDVIIQDLEELKKTIYTHCGIVEKTELIMNILNYKLYEIQYNFRTEVDRLKAKKESLSLASSEKEDPTIALKIVEIDDEVSRIEETHQTNLDCIKEQKIEAQKAYEDAVQELDQNLNKMTDGLNKLLILIEAEKATVGESQSDLVDAKFDQEVEELKTQIDKFAELQTTGWKVLYPEEKISEMLQERGLKILQTGHLITDDGLPITYREAKESKMLENLSPDVLKELRTHILGGGDDSTIRSTLSTLSIGSRISSEDVNYLKQSLGKALTLAIAEITAVQPRDPIHYLGHWLFKYRYNQQMEDVNSAEFEILNEKRNKIAKERWHKFVEEEARAAVIDMIIRAEQIAILNELRRIQEEEENEEQVENYDDEARDILGPL